MGDSIAPKITISDNKSETSSVVIDWQSVDPSPSLAFSVTGNAALAATLAGRKDSSNFLPSDSSQSVSPDISTADFYFPLAKRNVAPVIKFSNAFDDSNAKIEVSFDVIDHSMSGTSANAPDSVAFWKKKPTTNQLYAPDFVPYKAQGAEPISTELFEKYIPSSRRNKAPVINLKKPAFAGDESAYCFVETEYVGLNIGLAEKLAVNNEGIPKASNVAQD